MRFRVRLIVRLLGLALLLMATPTFGQVDWTATLVFNPFPSPYLTDWENNPTIGQAGISNNTAGTVNILAFLTLHHNTRGLIASANSRIIPIPPGQLTSLTTTDLIDASSIDYDKSIEEISVRTGRLPEGQYRICLQLKSETDQLLLDNQCTEFTIVYPDPPYLVYPSDKESVVSKYPVLQWTPVQVPIGYQVHYDLLMAEVLEGQSAPQALAANYTQFRNNFVTSTSQLYPMDALPLQKGKTYAWQVQVLDNNGYPPSTNSGRSEIWTFTCDVDTMPPLVLRQLAGQVTDSVTGVALGSAQVVYRQVKRKISDNDTTWTEEQDSLVCITDNNGAFRFDSAADQSYYSLTTTKSDYVSKRLAGEQFFLSSDVRNLGVPLAEAPPGERRLSGVLRDFFSNDPVPNATVVYHVVEAVRSGDSTAPGLSYVETPRKRLEAVTDAEGRFEFTKAADSSFFSLRASKAPSYLPCADIGPNQLQVGDVDGYILLITPNAGIITGTLHTTIGGKSVPVPNALVRMVRTTTISVQTSLFGQTFEQTNIQVDSASQTAYSDASGLFRMTRVSQEKPNTVETNTQLNPFFPMYLQTRTSALGYSYRIAVKEKLYQPYLSPSSLTVEPGGTTESGEHRLTPISGSIVGRIHNDTLPVEGARVSLYPASYRKNSYGTKAGSRPTLIGTSPDQTVQDLGNTLPLPSDDTTWGNTASQRPEGEPLDTYVTGSDGTYGFATVPINDPDQLTDRYTIWVEGDGYNAAAQSCRLVIEGQVDTVDVSVVQVGGVIYGKVTASLDAAVNGARVELQRMDSLGTDSVSELPDPQWVFSGDDGAYSFGDITPGTYRLQFSKDGYNGLTTETIRVEFGSLLLYDANLSAAKGIILLTVQDKDGKNLSDVCVKSDQIPSLMGFTDRDGKLLIIDAPSGEDTLRLRKIDYADLDTTITVTANDTTRITVKLLKSVGEILVRVVEKGNTEKRLANMTVKIGKEESGKKPDYSLIKSTDERGEVVFTGAPSGPQTITVSPPTDTIFQQDYVINETQTYIYSGLNAQPLTIQMEPAARMQGKVTNKESGASLPGVTVTIEGNTKVKTETDSGGSFTLRNVPSGATLTLLAKKGGFKSARYKHDKAIAVGDKITGIAIELEESPMDSLFGFEVALDSVKSGISGRSRVWGTLTNVPPTFGLKLKDEVTTIEFANLEVDSNYRPTSDSVSLVQKELEVTVFGLEAKLKFESGLHLQWVDSVKAGRISGALTLIDPISKAFPESEFLDITIPKKNSPSFWTGGINHGLDKYGLTSTKNEVQVKIKSVTLGLDFNKSTLDTGGMHLFGSIQFGTSFTVGFEDMNIGKDEAGDLIFKGITIRTKPAIKIPFGVFTVIDSTLTWEATGFKASGAIVLNALDNKEFGFKDLHISPTGEFLSLTVTADEKNGTITVYGQKFIIEKLEFGTQNFESQSLPHTKYFAFTGKLELSKLDKPVGMNLRYDETGLFTGKLEFNQSRSFGGIVTISLESIELGYDSSKTDRFVGFSGGVKFTSMVGLSLQASNLRFYLAGGVEFDKMAMDFQAGPVQVKVSVSYLNEVFEGKGWFEVRPVVSAGAEFRYGGPNDWWVRIISGTRIPMGPAEIVQASGGIGRKDNVWKFSIGGVVAPAKADKGIRLELLVEVQKTPKGVIILGNAAVEVASGTQIGRATIEINLPEKRICGSIVFAMDYKAITASAQLDLYIKFDEYWYVYGRANIDALKFFKNTGVIVVANNWNWQHDGKTELMNGIYIELNSLFKIDADWFVIKWGANFDRHAMVYVGWNGDFAGAINMAGGAYAWIGFGPFDLIQARANMAMAAHLSYIEPEWSAGARGNFNLQGSIGWCGNAGCWTICWQCFVRIFGHCVFALPTGATACVGMNARVEYSTSKGMSFDASF